MKLQKTDKTIGAGKSRYKAENTKRRRSSSLVFFACCFAFCAFAADSNFSDPNNIGDISSPSVWGGTMPGTTSSDRAIFKNQSKTLTAKSDVTFGIMRFERTSGMMHLVFDMTDSSAGISDGAGPRKVNLFGMQFSGHNNHVDIKDGLWDFYVSSSSDKNVVSFNSNSNAVLTLCNGAVVTNIANGGYGHISYASYSAIRLTGQSLWHARSSFWPIKGGNHCCFQVLEGSKCLVDGELELGRLGSVATSLSRNGIEIAGNGSFLKVDGTTYIGGYPSTTGGSHGTYFYVTNNAIASLKNISMGYKTRGHEFLVDGATLSASKISIGSTDDSSSNNVFRVCGNANVNAQAIYVGRNGSCGNELVIENSNVDCSDSSYAVIMGSVPGTDTARGGSNNLIRVAGAGASFTIKAATPFFGKGDGNTFEVDGATLSWSGKCSFEFSNEQFSNMGNKVVLRNGSYLTASNFRLGNSAANNDRGGHVLDISGGSRLSANWIMVYSNDTVRINIPRQGLDKPSVTVSQQLQFNLGSILDIDASEWKEGPSTCVLIRSQYGTTTGDSPQVRVDQNTLDAVNARLGGRFIVTLEGRDLTIHRVRGITVNFR